MGIANTTASAALIAVFTGSDPDAGHRPGHRHRRPDLAAQGRRWSAAPWTCNRPDPADPLGVLAAIGGLEHAALAGFMLGGAALRVPVVLDGVIACAAALAARALAPDVLGAPASPGTCPAEPGARRALDALGLRPLLDLGLRLGEGIRGAAGPAGGRGRGPGAARGRDVRQRRGVGREGMSWPGAGGT